MANKILLDEQNGTPKQICFRDVTDFGPAAANDLRVGTPTLVQLDMTSVADAAYRQSTKVDLGAVRAPAYAVRAALEFAAGVVAGEIMDFWWAPSGSATAGTANAGGVSGADGAYTGYSSNAAASVRPLEHIGVGGGTAPGAHRGPRPRRRSTSCSTRSLKRFSSAAQRTHLGRRPPRQAAVRGGGD